MNNRNLPQTIDCQIVIQSPVHIGCDEVYEPTGFVLDRSGPALVIFDPTSFISGLSPEDRAKFSAICKQGTVGSLLEVFRFLRSHPPAGGRRVDVCQGFEGHYQDVLKLDEKKVNQELNRFQIMRTAFRPYDGRPYLPGSAVKGALRTAWLNLMAREKAGLPTPRPTNDKRNKPNLELERALMDQRDWHLEYDPFRLVKVSDFQPVGETPAKVVYAVNWSKKPEKGAGKGPYQILEVILPGAEFVGSISIQTPPPGCGILRAPGLEDLWRALGFYAEEKKRENSELARLGALTQNAPGLNASRQLRLGRHSGAECVTIEGHRNILIMKGKGQKPGFSKTGAFTLWLAAESSKPDNCRFLQPFGWAALATLSADAKHDLDQAEKSWIATHRLAELERLDRKRAEQEALAEENRLKKDAEAKEEEERIRKEQEKTVLVDELAAMTPAQKDAAALAGPGLTDNAAYEIYGCLGKYQGEDLLLVAEALRSYFQSVNKWKKKQCTEKQWQKVCRLKEILGED